MKFCKRTIAVFSLIEINFYKTFSTFTGVCGGWKYWSIKNCL